MILILRIRKIVSKKCKNLRIEHSNEHLILKIRLTFIDKPIFRETALFDNEVDEIPETNPQAVSKKAKSRKKDVVVYAQNPFWKPTEVKIGTKRVTMAGGYIAKNDTGETISMAGIHRVEYVDETRFIKLFTDNSAWFFDLSKPAQKLLRFIVMTLQNQPGKDGIWFSWQDCEDWIKTHQVTGLSRPSYHRALSELLHKQLIGESEKTNFFWVNGNVFFNGDRLVYINEYRKVKAIPKKSVPTLEAPNREPSEQQLLEAAGQQRLVE